MVEIKKLENSEVEIKGEIPTEDFEKFRGGVLKKLSQGVEIDGFRKGHVPESVLEKNVSEIHILEKMAEEALSLEFPKIIKENKIDAIGYPKINITKLAKGNPLGFTIVVTVMPEINLPDYKKISADLNKKIETVEVTSEDIENTIKSVRQMRAKEEAKGAEIKEGEPLPDLDDEYVKKLGDFKNVEDFKNKIQENIKSEKEFRAKDKKRLEIIESIIEKSKLIVPKVLIEAETHKMLHRMRADIENMGLKYEDYLKHIKKTEEDLENDWKEDAEKRAKLQLIVTEIAKVENISASEDRVKEEIKKVTEMYKDVDPENARNYIEGVLQNEEVFKFLEAQK